MPRPYRLGQRLAATEQTRSRIIAAARDLLTAPDGLAGFTIEAVARQADVARMTVYYQFSSKIGLLEALCDDLATRGGMDQLATAFHQESPLAALAELIMIFSRFWDSDRLITRRLRSLAALDPELEQVVRARDERRRRGLRAILRRLGEQRGRPAPAGDDELVEILFTLSSFESFDTLAGPNRRCEEVAPIIQRLARAAIELQREGW